VAVKAAAFRNSMATYAAHVRFRLLYTNEVTAWWGHNAEVAPVTSWLEMMVGALETTADHIRGWQHTSQDCLFLEFGVGSGKTTAVIAWKLKQLYGEHGATIHGFDSFQGIPESWDHTNLVAGTFSMDGEIPEHLVNMTNVKVHVGLFNETLPDLNPYLAAKAPVAFAHIDVDLYSSSVQVLSHIACSLIPGSVLVFDELVNYVGFEKSGEYRAWQYIANRYQIDWDYGGIFWQQALPIVIIRKGLMCE
jgi:hypothetical protein